MPFGPVGLTVVAHRLVHRREDRGDPLIATFVEWIRDAMSRDRAHGLARPR